MDICSAAAMLCAHRTQRHSMNCGGQVAPNAAGLAPTGQALVACLQALEETVRRHCRLLERQNVRRPLSGNEGIKTYREGAGNHTHSFESTSANPKRRDKVSGTVRE